jgi:hypothetical protein
MAPPPRVLLLPTGATYPSLRLMRGLVRSPPPTFLIGSGHLGGRKAIYLKGPHSAPQPGQSQQCPSQMPVYSCSLSPFVLL